MVNRSGIAKMSNPNSKIDRIRIETKKLKVFAYLFRRCKQSVKGVQLWCEGQFTLIMEISTSLQLNQSMQCSLTSENNF